MWRNIDRANKQERSTESASEEIDLRARVYSLGPVNELIHRGWITGSRNADELRDQVLEFYDLAGLTSYPASNSTRHVRPPCTRKSPFLRLPGFTEREHFAEELKPAGSFTDERLELALTT